jgi:hypothetical protein
VIAPSTVCMHARVRVCMHVCAHICVSVCVEQEEEWPLLSWRVRCGGWGRRRPVVHCWCDWQFGTPAGTEVAMVGESPHTITPSFTHTDTHTASPSTISLSCPPPARLKGCQSGAWGWENGPSGQPRLMSPHAEFDWHGRSREDGWSCHRGLVMVPLLQGPRAAVLFSLSGSMLNKLADSSHISHSGSSHFSQCKT